MSDKTPGSAHGSAPFLSVPLSALLLCVVIALTFADVMFSLRYAGVAAMPFLLGYILREWRIMLGNTRILLIASAVLALVMALKPGGIATLVMAAGRTIFLPSFIALLGLLRVAAAASEAVAKAGRWLIAQKPSRRYVALTAGGQIFGILFNIGGLALLIDMTKSANTLVAAGGNAAVVEMRLRRMTMAIMRGFSTIALWSPLGVALNLLLASMPGVAWIEVAPYGLGFALVFMGLGLVFDWIETPRTPNGRGLAPVAEPRGGLAVAQVAAHVVALSLIALIGELSFNVTFQTVLLYVVPFYALCWLYAIYTNKHEPAPLRTSLVMMRDAGISRWPLLANEIAIFATSGFLGIILASLVPREIMSAVLSFLAGAPGLMAVGLALLVFVLGMLGVNPIITASILASAVSTVDVPGLSKANILLALAAGWTCVISTGPLMSSLVMVSNMIGRSPWTVGLVWNGRFIATALAVFLAMLLFIRI